MNAIAIVEPVSKRDMPTLPPPSEPESGVWRRERVSAVYMQVTHLVSAFVRTDDGSELEVFAAVNLDIDHGGKTVKDVRVLDAWSGDEMDGYDFGAAWSRVEFQLIEAAQRKAAGR